MASQEKTLNTRIVLRNDSTANWKVKPEAVLLKGEVGIEFLENGQVKMRIGDGTTAWSALPYFGGEDSHVYEVTASASENDLDKIAEKVGQTELHTGDSAIVKRTFANGKVSHTAYVWDGSWKAMDGNYNAENVYFDKNLQTTVAIGNIGLTNGQATISSAGKNLNEVWQAIFVKAKDPVVTSPSVEFSNPGIKYLEIGTSSTSNVSLSFEDGKYEFGYDEGGKVINNGITGVNANKYHINYDGAEVSSTNSVEINSGVKTKKSSMSVSGSVEYSDGSIPVNNIGEKIVGKQIKAGTVKASDRELFRWYVPMYSGFKYSNDVIAAPAKITNSEVKSLTPITGEAAFNATLPVSATASKAWRQWFVAVPADYKKNISGAKDSNNLTQTVVKANDVTINYNGTDVIYNVWFINNAADYKTQDITISW